MARKIGLALGSGSARGWSHIGVIRALADLGIKPDIVCGTSIGALVGASFASGNLDKLESWVTSLDRFDVARFLEVNWSMTGFINKERLRSFLVSRICEAEQNIEDLDVIMATVATELQNGREVWFTNGPVMEAVWASMSLPGLFPPLKHGERWLVDGGLVNPVPVSVCRALGADLVIAVNLNGNIASRHFIGSSSSSSEVEEDESSLIESIKKTAREYSRAIFSVSDEDDGQPSLFDIIAGSVNITQDRITRSRMAGDPPEVVVTPRLADIGLMDFHRASDAIEEGRHSVNRKLPEISAFLEINNNANGA